MGDYIVTDIAPFDLALTLECGQAFRWNRAADGCFEGIAMGRFLRVRQLDGGDLVLYDTTEEEYRALWRDYFDLGRDYGAVVRRARQDERLRTVTQGCEGIRILRQQPWEALCSFIISQNNHIPRIKGIISRLCEQFGDPIPGGYAFPPPERLAGLTVEDLAGLRSGFRAKYILDAARRCSGELDLEGLRALPIDRAREQLMTVSGVGPKVADCALLYGLGFVEAFPMDVWMKRAMRLLFDGRLPDGLTDCAGIIQQYIFYYARQTKCKAE